MISGKFAEVRSDTLAGPNIYNKRDRRGGCDDLVETVTT